MNLAACWSEICDVDVGPLVEWLEKNPQTWPDVAENKPARVWELSPIFRETAEWLAGQVHLCAPGDPVCPVCVVHQPMLSYMAPGYSHPMHADTARADWITRVHVPLVTNEGCWFSWEDDSEYLTGRAYFAVGKAYSFDMTRRHAFGNHGETERIHLIFDVLRRD